LLILRRSFYCTARTASRGGTGYRLQLYLGSLAIEMATKKLTKK